MPECTAGLISQPGLFRIKSSPCTCGLHLLDRIRILLRDIVVAPPLTHNHPRHLKDHTLITKHSPLPS